MLRKRNRSLIASYKTTRRVIGFFGLSLPFICVLGGLLFSNIPVQPSVSCYYFTNTKDILVGFLICISLFLLLYNGYELIDSLVLSWSGVAGLGAALFPCSCAKNSAELIGFFQLSPAASGVIHIVCISVFFFLSAINSIFLFTLTDKRKEMTRDKRTRNIFHIGCGLVILVALSIQIILISAVGPDKLNQSVIGFILESVMFMAFGISWLVKGKMIFGEKNDGKMKS